MVDGESCFLDTPTPEAFDVVTQSTSQSTYIKACKMLSITPSTFCFRCLNEISLVIPHHGIGPNGAKAVAIALVVNFYIYRCIINLNCFYNTFRYHFILTTIFYDWLCWYQTNFCFHLFSCFFWRGCNWLVVLIFVFWVRGYINIPSNTFTLLKFTLIFFSSRTIRPCPPWICPAMVWGVQGCSTYWRCYSPTKTYPTLWVKCYVVMFKKARESSKHL